MYTNARSSSPTRALITGGMGFIGSHLSESLLQKGYHVTVVDNTSTGQFRNIEHLVGNPNFHFAIDDISNQTVTDRLVSECDVVFHMAASVGVQLIVENPVQTVTNNVIGTDEILKAAVRYRTKVLIASTSEVYGKGISIPFTEDDDVVLGPTSRSRWAYAASKMIDEFLALAYYRQTGLPVVVFRLFNTVGPRQRGRYGMVIPRFVRQALEGQPITIYGDGKQSRCFLHVRDAVAAIVALNETPQAVGQVFNIGSHEEVNIQELAHQVLAHVDAYHQGIPFEQMPISTNGAMDERLRYIPYSDAYPPGFEDMRRRVPNTAKLTAYTGWQQTRNLSETLQDVITEFVAQAARDAAAEPEPQLIAYPTAVAVAA
ncbi:MAG: GDP-mannose 4,6-dehydratase [Litorilinea sp.]